jgi:hypothetical protein
MMLVRVIRTHREDRNAAIGTYGSVNTVLEQEKMPCAFLKGVLSRHVEWIKCTRLQCAISLPVPWAGDDRTRRGARDISCSCWLFRREVRRTRCSSSGPVSDVAMFLAFSGRTCNS